MCLMRILLCLLACTAVLPAKAQQAQYPPAPLFAGQGAYSEQFIDPFSFLGNTAALAGCVKTGAGVFAENKFGLPELKNFTAAAQAPLGGGAIGLVTHYSGSRHFNQSQAGIAFGKELGRIRLGARLNYSMMRITGYGSSGAVSMELGSTWKLTEKFFTGIQITNPVGGKFGNEGTEKLPSVYTVGAGYECSNQVWIGAAITKEEDRPVSFRADIHYTLSRRLFTWLGLNSNTASPAFALGWQWKGFRVMVSGSWHSQLGVTSALGLLFETSEN